MSQSQPPFWFAPGPRLMDGAAMNACLNMLVLRAPNLEALRGLVGDATSQAQLAGAVIQGDGAGGSFYWDPDATAADDGVNVVRPTSVRVGAWRRISFFGPWDIVPSGADQTAEIAALLQELAAGTRQSIVFEPFGRYIVSGATTTDYLLDGDLTNAQDRPAIMGNGSTLIYRWDPALPDTTVTNMWRLRNSTDLSVTGFRFDMSPSLFTQGKVTAVTATYWDFLVDAGMEPAFTTMNWVGEINPLTGAFIAKQSEDDNQDDSGNTIAYPIVAQGGGVYRCTPVLATTAITGVSSTNPLTFTTADDSRFSDGNLVSITGVVGLMVGPDSLVNGLDFVVYKSGNRLELRDPTDPDQTIDGSGATAYVSGGTITTIPVPIWLGVGDTIACMCRRTLGNLFYLRGNTRPYFNDLDLVCFPAVAIKGDDNRDVHIGTIQAQGPGWLAGSSGLVNLTDGLGYFRCDSAVAYGLGADMFNVGATRIWDPQVTAWGIAGGAGGAGAANKIKVSAWNTRNGPSNRPVQPAVGDVIEFYDLTGLVFLTTSVTAVSADGLTITLADNVPAGYDPTTSSTNAWRVVNRTRVTANRWGSVYQNGGAARCIISPSHSTDIDVLDCSGLHAYPLRLQSPTSGRHTTRAGFKGGVRVGYLRASYCNYVYHQFTSSVITVQVSDANGSIITTPSGWEPIDIGTLVISHNQFGGVMAGGVDINIGTAIMHNSGESRSTIASLTSSKPGYNDYWAQAATITRGVDENLNTTRTFYQGTAGLVQTVPNLQLGYKTAAAVLATDSVAVANTVMLLDTEGAAASDNLVTLTGGMPGQVLVLRAFVANRTVTVKSTGNIVLLNGDCPLANTDVSIILLKALTTDTWREIARSERVRGVTVYTGTADVTFKVATDGPEILLTGNLAGDITVTLSTSNAATGRVFWLARSGIGAGNANVVDGNGAALLNAMATDTWCKCVYNSPNWYRAGQGTR
jgi:hypothetical protein